MNSANPALGEQVGLIFSSEDNDSICIGGAGRSSGGEGGQTKIRSDSEGARTVWASPDFVSPPVLNALPYIIS